MFSSFTPRPNVALIGDVDVAVSLIWTMRNGYPPSADVIESPSWVLHKIAYHGFSITPFPPASSAVLSPQVPCSLSLGSARRSEGRREGNQEDDHPEIGIDLRCLDSRSAERTAIGFQLRDAHLVGLCYNLADGQAVQKIRHEESTFLLERERLRFF